MISFIDGEGVLGSGYIGVDYCRMFNANVARRFNYQVLIMVEYSRYAKMALPRQNDESKIATHIILLDRTFNEFTLVLLRKKYSLPGQERRF